MKTCNLLYLGIFTAHIQKLREGNVFAPVCPLTGVGVSSSPAQVLSDQVLSAEGGGVIPWSCPTKSCSDAYPCSPGPVQVLSDQVLSRGRGTSWIGRAWTGQGGTPSPRTGPEDLVLFGDIPGSPSSQQGHDQGVPGQDLVRQDLERNAGFFTLQTGTGPGGTLPSLTQDQGVSPPPRPPTRTAFIRYGRYVLRSWSRTSFLWITWMAYEAFSWLYFEGHRVFHLVKTSLSGFRGKP